MTSRYFRRMLQWVRSLFPYVGAGFLLAWMVVQNAGWDSEVATRDGHLLQFWSYFILLTLTCLGAILQSMKRR